MKGVLGARVCVGRWVGRMGLSGGRQGRGMGSGGVVV